ncbi:hypothetical protein ONE63_000327 [Megalurothrips usitatus]|uniref:Uncharacterized protein n=1 Tax=Megalurothrips usitatus TaxID=439358 RepID=A0AAV7XY38_9NEOP|nr:hypothetical protein ONE63_000327 [Megalurothrips usitatus]
MWSWRTARWWTTRGPSSPPTPPRTRRSRSTSTPSIARTATTRRPVTRAGWRCRGPGAP